MRSRRRAGRLALVLALPLCAGTWACQPMPGTVRMATTASVENSGLLAAILPAFEQQHGVVVEVLPVGSGQALSLLKRGDASVGLTHDPAAESSALEAGAITGYRKIMFNDFVIVGPPADPAGITLASDAVNAMQRIGVHGAVFVSRGDASGTYSREQELWSLAGKRPAAERLLETGQGMAATLRVASEKHAYTLTDRATFRQLQPRLHLVSLFEGGTVLLNTYAVLLRSGLTGAELDAATALADWLANGDGRHLVAGFLANGRPVFTIWPAGTPRDHPKCLPNAR